MRFKVRLTAGARADLRAISDTRSRAALTRRALKLEADPLTQGKVLGDDLKGYMSVRAGGQRYRIIYSASTLEGAVTVVVIGIRKEGDRRDVYEVARKRLGKPG